MSVSSTSLTRFFGQMISAMRLLVLTMLLGLHFIFVACDSGSVKEEEDSLQTTQTAQPNDPVVVGTTDDQTPPTVSLDNTTNAYPTGIVMDGSPILKFNSDEAGDVYITGASEGDGANLCPAKLFESRADNGTNCVEIYSSSSSSQSILELASGNYECKLVVIDSGGNQGSVNLNFTIVSPTSQAGELLNNLQDNMSGTTSTANSTCPSSDSADIFRTAGRADVSRTAGRADVSRTAGRADVSRTAGREFSMEGDKSSAVLVKVAEDLKNSGLLESSNLLELMPKMVEFFQKNLKEAELHPDNTTQVVQNMLGTLISSMKGREGFMKPSSAEPGLSVQTTLLKNITKSSVSNLAAAFEMSPDTLRSAASSHNRSGSDLAKDTGNLIDAIVGSMGKSGVDASEVGSTMTEVTGTAVASLGEVDGMDVENLGDALKEITSKATAAIAKAVADVTNGSSSNSTDLVTLLIANTTSAATKSLGKIEMPGISSDYLGSMVENVTKGAIAALGEVAGSNGNLDIADLISEVSSSATESLGEIEMPGFSAANLSEMLVSVNKGASEGLEDIETTDDNDKLAFLEKIQEGSTKALDDIVMPGFDPEEQKKELEIKIKDGTSSGFLTLLEKMNVAKINSVKSDNDSSKIYKENDVIIIEVVFSTEVKFAGSIINGHFPYLEIDTGTNKKIIRDEPARDLVRKAYWIGIKEDGKFSQRTGSKSKSHFFKYKVASADIETAGGNVFLLGDETEKLDLYSNNSLILPEGLELKASGSASTNVMMFTPVGNAAGSLAKYELKVDAKKPVIRHPVPLPRKGKEYLNYDVTKSDQRYCIRDKNKACINKNNVWEGAGDDIQVTFTIKDKSILVIANDYLNKSYSKQLRLTNDNRTRISFITDELGEFYIKGKDGFCDIDEMYKSTDEYLRLGSIYPEYVIDYEFPEELSDGDYDECKLFFKDEAENETQIEISKFTIDASPPKIKSAKWIGLVKSGIRKIGNVSDFWYANDNLSKIEIEVTDNKGGGIMLQILFLMIVDLAHT